MSREQEILDSLAGLALFADLGRAELESVAHIFSEEWHPQGERIIRQGFTGTGFYVILDGEVQVLVDGEERATLGRGEFFGEMSVVLDQPPVADIVALRPLRSMHLAGPALESFLVDHPRVMYRMLQAVARRLRNANLWRS
jgi:CRP-like cAMP-binding protein